MHQFGCVQPKVGEKQIGSAPGGHAQVNCLLAFLIPRLLDGASFCQRLLRLLRHAPMGFCNFHVFLRGVLVVANQGPGMFFQVFSLPPIVGRM